MESRLWLHDLWTVTGLSKETGQVVQRWVVWAPTRDMAVQAVAQHGILATEEELSAAAFRFEYESDGSEDLVAVAEV